MAMHNAEIVQYQKALCVRGYHVDKKIWEASTGKIRLCMVETGNSHERNIVTGEKDRKAIGHLSQKVLWLCAFF